MHNQSSILAPLLGLSIVHVFLAPTFIIASVTADASGLGTHATAQPHPPEPTSLKPYAPAFIAASPIASSLSVLSFKPSRRAW